MKHLTKVYFICILVSTVVPDVVAQNQVLQQFEAYRQTTLQEKIFLHADKDFYLTGEICWFKIYAVDAFFHRPLGLNKVAYVEILDKSNKPVLQAKIALKDGDGNGSLYLPGSMGSGKYKLRAYTNWMKNFSADYFFEKLITVINPRKIYQRDTLQQKTVYAIKFFPEGGNLVNGIQSKIAFHIVDQNGKGIQCRGIVINDKTDTVAKYATLKFGIGSFVLTPEAGHTYKAVMTLPGGKTMMQELPMAYTNGFVMHLAAAGNDQLKISVHAPVNTSLPSTVYLFAHTRGAVKSVETGNMQNGYTEFLVDKRKLGNGISHFTLFNKDRQPVCERLYFKYPEQRLEAGMTTDSQEYAQRKKIKIHVTATDQDGLPTQANMSIAVYRIDSLQAIDEVDINNYLWLSADLSGTIESPGYYFSNNGAGTEEAMDNLMLTHGWRRFRWEDILQHKKAAFEFVPEYAGHIISGKITKTGTGLPAKETEAFLSVAGTRTQFRPAISDSNGYVRFDAKDFYNEGQIIVQTNSQQDSLCSIEVSSPFAEKYSSRLLPDLSFREIHRQTLLNHHISVQVQKAYSGNKLNQFSFPVVDTTAFYFKPDITYLLDNYVRFTTMEEVLREYVTPALLRRRNGKFNLYVFDEPRQQFFETNPMVLLDGVPVFDMNKLMNYDPLKIRKMEVVTRMYCLGKMFFTGIVNFVTYNGELQGYELDPHATVIDYEGLQLQREFFSPLYETQQQVDSRLPDFRNLLYWSPAIKTNEQGKTDINFYTSDLPGKYAVVLQGLTHDGKTGSKVIFLKVAETIRHQ